MPPLLELTATTDITSIRCQFKPNREKEAATKEGISLLSVDKQDSKIVLQIIKLVRRIYTEAQFIRKSSN